MRSSPPPPSSTSLSRIGVIQQQQQQQRNNTPEPEVGWANFSNIRHNEAADAGAGPSSPPPIVRRSQSSITVTKRSVRPIVPTVKSMPSKEEYDRPRIVMTVSGSPETEEEDEEEEEGPPLSIGIVSPPSQESTSTLESPNPSMGAAGDDGFHTSFFGPTQSEGSIEVTRISPRSGRKHVRRDSLEWVSATEEEKRVNVVSPTESEEGAIVPSTKGFEKSFGDIDFPKDMLKNIPMAHQSHTPPASPPPELSEGSDNADPPIEVVGKGTLLGPVAHLNPGSIPPPPPPPPPELPLAVPKYSANRMLMPSPLPSPVQALRKKMAEKKVPRQPLTRSSSCSSNSSSSPEEKAKQREESALARLVHMAKQQQSFAAAWFAASSAMADEFNIQDFGPRPRRRRSQSPARSVADSSVSSRSEGSSLGNGPVDVDSGEMWSDDEDDRSTVSSRIRKRWDRFAKLSRSSDPMMPTGLKEEKGKRLLMETGPGVKVDVESGLPVDVDGFMDEEEDKDGRIVKFVKGGDVCCSLKLGGTRRTITTNLVLLLLLFIVVFCGIGAVVTLVARPGQSASSSTISTPYTFGPTFSPFPTYHPTNPPTLSPTLPPTTGAPTSPHPSSSPSFTPTSTPTSTPTLSPSSSPTTTPTQSPTTTQTPTSAPSSSPTTKFATTLYSQIGGTTSGTAGRDQAGYAVALSADGSIQAIGSRYNAGVDFRSGEVRVFRRQTSRRNLEDGTQWLKMGQSIRGRRDNDQCGFSVSLSDDGRRLAVSEPGYDGPLGDRSGNVRVFDFVYTNETYAAKVNSTSPWVWVQVGQDLVGEMTNDLSGVSVSLSGDGRRLAVGTPYHDNDGYGGSKSGRVRVYRQAPTSTGGVQWAPMGLPLDGSDINDWFGWSVSLSRDGSRIVCGAPRNSDGGYFRTHEWDAVEGKWDKLTQDVYKGEDADSQDRFAVSVSLSSDGKRVAIGSPWSDSNDLRNSGLAAVYQLVSNGLGDDEWRRMGPLIVGDEMNDQLGWAVSLSGNGDRVAIGIPGNSMNGVNSGAVSVHRWTGFEWDGAKPVYGDMLRDDFGFSVAANDNGSIVAVGAPVQIGTNDGSKGYSRVFEWDGF